jgi:hypothetical protein
MMKWLQMQDKQSFTEKLARGVLWKDTVASAKRFLIAMLLLIPAVLL